jgi:hypothetical protein
VEGSGGRDLVFLGHALHCGNFLEHLAAHVSPPPLAMATALTPPLGPPYPYRCEPYTLHTFLRCGLSTDSLKGVNAALPSDHRPQRPIDAQLAVCLPSSTRAPPGTVQRGTVLRVIRVPRVHSCYDGWEGDCGEQS